MKKLILASHNAGKVRELKELLEGEPVEVLSLKDIGWTEEIVEDGDSFKANALIKARRVFEATGEAVLADDSGLEIEALGGAPGVYSARYMGEETSYEFKCDAILRLLERVPESRRGADYRCVAAFIRPGRWKKAVVKTAEGRVDGRVAYEQAGRYGFGYDPIFYLPEEGCPMAELPDEIKNNISHRGRAIRAILPEIRKWLNQ